MLVSGVVCVFVERATSGHFRLTVLVACSHWLAVGGKRRSINPVWLLAGQKLTTERERERACVCVFACVCVACIHVYVWVKKGIAIHTVGPSFLGFVCACLCVCVWERENHHSWKEKELGVFVKEMLDMRNTDSNQHTLTYWVHSHTVCLSLSISRLCWEVWG